MSALPYASLTNTFNPNDFTALDSSLSLATADQRYVQIGSAGYLSSLSTVGNVDAASFSLSGASLNISAISGVTAGTASASKALIVDASRNITNINSLTTTSLTVNGSLISSSDLTFLSGITAGTCTDSKALVVDSSKNITGIGKINITSSNATTTTGTTNASAFGLNILSTVNSNGTYNSSALAFLNAASDAIPHGVIQINRTAAASADIVISTRSAANNLSENLRILSTGALSINYGASPIAMISCVGSTSYVDGGYQRLLRLETTNATPVKFEIQLNSSTAATTTNATFIGNITSNDIYFGTNDSGYVAIKHTGSMMIVGSKTAISSGHKLEVVGSTLVTDSTNTYTMPSSPSLGLMYGAQASANRSEFLTFGKYVSGSDYSSWTLSSYYQNATQDTANYMSLCPTAKTSTSTGWGFVMNRNGQCSFQDSNANSGSGGLVVGGNIVAAVDIYGGVTRTVSTAGYLQSNAGTPATYTASVSTRIGLYVVNAIWTADKVYASSDRRLKRDIEPIPLDEAKKLLDVEPVTYRWKKNDDSFNPDVGLIAQDVLAAGLDKLVSYCPNNDKEHFPLGYNYGVEYSRVPVYLLTLVKDLYKRIKTLEERNKNGCNSCER